MSNPERVGARSSRWGLATAGGVALLTGAACAVSVGPGHCAGAGGGACPPTRPDGLGPFYQPGAPVRASVGTGYELAGTVRSTAGCAPIAAARVELWLAGPSGEYDDAHRATVIADADGRYRFESSPPPPYGQRPPHIHLRVTAAGFESLVTQHYPAPGQTRAEFDLVLIPSR